MGVYLCIASNGIPPTVMKQIKVSVDCEYIPLNYLALLFTIIYRCTLSRLFHCTRHDRTKLFRLYRLIQRCDVICCVINSQTTSQRVHTFAYHFTCCTLTRGASSANVTRFLKAVVPHGIDISKSFRSKCILWRFRMLVNRIDAFTK